MPRIDNTEFYNASLKKHKQNPLGLHWSSKERQNIRFEVFRKLLDKQLCRLRIVDAGCGFGDLYTYLEDKNSQALEYIGIDTHKKMVKIAQKSTGKKIIHADIISDILPRADYYLCSGAMNILEPFDTLLFIKKMIDASDKGVIFNLLQGERGDAIYNKQEPEKLQKNLAFFDGSIDLYDDYLEGDFTLHLKKRVL